MLPQPLAESLCVFLCVSARSERRVSTVKCLCMCAGDSFFHNVQLGCSKKTKKHELQGAKAPFFAPHFNRTVEANLA